MLVCAGILEEVSQPERMASADGTYVVEAGHDIRHVAARILVELLVVAKDNDGDIDGAEDGQLMGFFKETALAFEKGAGDGVS